MQNMQKHVFVAYKGFWKLSRVQNKCVWCTYTRAINNYIWYVGLLKYQEMTEKIKTVKFLFLLSIVYCSRVDVKTFWWTSMIPLSHLSFVQCEQVKFRLKKKVKIITIHYECPCRIGKSHPRGRNFYQGRGLPSPWLKFGPRGWNFLPYMDWLMMDYFSPILVDFKPQIRFNN